MTKFLLAYHGGSVPDPDAQEEVMTAWFAWFGSLGDALVDGGNPIGPASTIKADGNIDDNGGPNPVSGYSIIDAADMAAAIELAKGCPVVAAGGSIEVAQTIDI